LLKGIDLGPKESALVMSGNSFDWGDMVAFPKSIADLDNCQKVLMYGEELGMSLMFCDK
jgi:hypothetical protein